MREPEKEKAVMIRELGRVILAAFEDPETEKAFKKWQAAREKKAQGGAGECFTQSTGAI